MGAAEGLPGALVDLGGIGEKPRCRERVELPRHAGGAGFCGVVKILDAELMHDGQVSGVKLPSGFCKDALGLGMC